MSPCADSGLINGNLIIPCNENNLEIRKSLDSSLLFKILFDTKVKLDNFIKIVVSLFEKFNNKVESLDNIRVNNKILDLFTENKKILSERDSVDQKIITITSSSVTDDVVQESTPDSNQDSQVTSTESPIQEIITTESQISSVTESSLLFDIVKGIKKLIDEKTSSNTNEEKNDQLKDETVEKKSLESEIKLEDKTVENKPLESEIEVGMNTNKQQEEVISDLGALVQPQESSGSVIQNDSKLSTVDNSNHEGASTSIDVRSEKIIDDSDSKKESHEKTENEDGGIELTVRSKNKFINKGIETVGNAIGNSVKGLKGFLHL